MVEKINNISKAEKNDQEPSTNDHIDNINEQEDIHQEFNPKNDQNQSPKS